MSMWPTPSKNPGHQGSGELLWLAVLHWLMPTGLHWAEHCKLAPGLPYPLHYVPFSLANFNLYPFTVINYNHQYNNFSDFWIPIINYSTWGCSWRGWVIICYHTYWFLMWRWSWGVLEHRIIIHCHIYLFLCSNHIFGPIPKQLL